MLAKKSDFITVLYVIGLQLILGCTSALSQTNQPPAIYPYPENGVYIGQGWDSFNEQGTTASCVDVDAIPLERSTFQSEVEQVRSTYSLIKKTTTSVSASYKGTGVSASGSISTSNQSTVNSDNQNFLFVFESQDGSTYAVPPETSNSSQFELSESAINLVKATNTPAAQGALLDAITKRPARQKGGIVRLSSEAASMFLDEKGKFNDTKTNEFREKCGDGYVAAIHRGARVHLLLTQKYRSNESKESLSAALSASGYGASGSASFSRSRTEFSDIDELGYRVFQQGGIPQSPKALALTIATDKTKFFDVNTILPTSDQLLSNPTAFRVTVVPYANVVNGLDQILPSPADLFTIGDYYIALNDLYALVGQIIDGDILGANDSGNTAAAFDPLIIKMYGGVSELQKLRDEIHDDLAFLELALEKCYKTKASCTLEKSLKDVDKDFENYAKDLKAKKNEIEASKIPPAEETAEAKQLRFDSVPGLKAVSAQLEEIVKKTDQYRLFISDKGELRSEFYLRFFNYLTRIPIPKVAYAKSEKFDTIRILAVKDKTTDAEWKAILEKSRAQLALAVFSFRLTPWKDFFCAEQKRAPMCLLDSALFSFADKGLPNFSREQFRIIYPPPPPPPKRPLPSCETSKFKCIK